MDPLQILTRSVKPQRRRPNHQRDYAASQGFNQNPQLYGDEEVLAHHSRKRKRGEEDLESPKDQQHVDFFEQLKQGSGGAFRDADPVESESDGGEIPRSKSTMDLSERQRILKQHKLKVNVMAEKSHMGGKREPKKKKSKSEGSRDKGENSKHAGQLYPEPLLHFGHLRKRYGTSKTLSRNTLEQGYKMPTEVQMASLPLLLEGFTEAGVDVVEEARIEELDLLTAAPTGSGKTIAFLIPLLHNFQRQHASDTSHGQRTIGPMAVILAPTKELVNQIVNEGRKLAIDMPVNIVPARKGIKFTAEANAEADTPASTTSSRAPDIIVGTPGSLLHLLQADDVTEAQASTDDSKRDFNPLSSVQTLILDEADVLLDPLFKSQTLTVLKALTSPKLRISLWSATISSTIESEIQALLASRRERIPNAVAAPLIRLVVGLKDSAVPNITHRLTYCATERGKLLALRDLLVPKTASTGTSLRAPFLVFTQTIERCTALHNELKYDIPASAGGSSRIAVLHSELPDRVRDRILTNFRKGEIWVLVTTDLLARGVDFRGVNGVVNYDVPTSAAGYVHRVGRTGRAGREGGVAVTLYTKEDVKYVKVVANVIAAAERARGKHGGEKGVEEWLLEALPDVSKEDRKKLKKRGVEERRKGRKEGRIDTRAGYVRKEANKRRDIVKASQRGAMHQRNETNGVSDAAAVENGDDFGGFSD
ncbi:ATP-dependent RNA helicase ROK1 [Sphaceloma murrayae]|uniref:RNA helicase n=1 Tax=Sphaceloma murrayae TaxID=2082308 RepID=A0A2K1QT90_9PEZI|nr:ATP-dependent RNA helicase ROK1 [Sphaceloma murrayae]